jgi:thioredoxin-related protein
MKRIVKFLLSIVVLFALGGCVNMDKKILLETQYNILDTVELTEAELVSKLQVEGNESGDDFVLYIYTPGCTGCASFKSIALKPFIKETSAVIYSVTNTLAKKYVSLSNKDASPVLVVYKNGKKVAKTGALYDEDTFASKEGLKSYLDKYVVISKMQYISSNDLDALIASNKEVIVYFSWNACGDCAAFKENFLNDYLLNNKSSKVFYMLETDEWRSQKQDHPEIWAEFTKKYELDSYQGGRIPSLVYYNEGSKVDMAVYLNDVMSMDEEGIKITGSYYEDAPFINKTYKTYEAYKEDVLDFHNQKIDDFLLRYYTKIR